MDQSVAAIDLGTTKICTLIAEVPESGKTLHIVGVGVEPSRGLRKGVVVNVNEAAEAIAASVESARRVSGLPIEAAFVGIGGNHLTAVNSRGVAAITRPDRGVCQDDVDRALQGAKAIAIQHNQVVLRALPRRYSIDSNDGITEPLGMHGHRIEVEAHVITCAESSQQNLIECVEAAGVAPLGPVPQPIAAAEAVLRQEERDAGVVLIDIGGGTTDIAVFIDGSIYHTAILPIGGMNITSDIAYGMRAPFEVAEEIKVTRGHAVPEKVRPDETVDVTSFGEESPQLFARAYLAQIIQARVEEIFGLVLKEIRHSGYDVLLSAGAVLCGGTAQLPGIKEAAKNALGMPVRIGIPGDIEGLVDTITTPAYATAVGLLRWGLDEIPKSMTQQTDSIVRRILDWIKEMGPG